MLHVHSYGSGFLFLPSVALLTYALEFFSFCLEGSFC